MSKRAPIWPFFVIAASTLVMLALLIWPAHSQEWNPYRTMRNACEWTNTCWKYRYDRWSGEWQRVRRVYRPRVYSYVRRDNELEDHNRGRGRCLSKHKALGSERYDIDKAKQDARQAWASAIRFHHGVIFADLKFARDVVFTCAQSATGERTTEKVVGALTGGGALQQCEISAVPCQAERVGDRD